MKSIPARMMCRLWQKRSTVLLVLLSVGSYVAYVCHSIYSREQYIKAIHSKGFAAHNYYLDVTKPRNKVSTNLDARQIFALLPHLQVYTGQIERLRSKLLAKTKLKIWPGVSPSYKIIGGYQVDYFEKLKKNNHVETVFFTANESAAVKNLPLKNYFDYGSSQLGCDRMVQRSWAIYHNGYELYNKTCQTDLNKTLMPNAIDRKSLSVGLPFQLSSERVAPTGHHPTDLILTFLNVIEYGLVSASGEVFFEDTCIITQRCMTQPKLPHNVSDVPFYDEVFTITEQRQIWYYHLTVEDLTRVAPYVLFLQEHPQIKVHISLASFFVEMLSLVGISSNRLVWGDVRARIVYLPAGTACGRPSVFTTSLLSHLMQQKTEQMIGKQQQDTIVIIHRSDVYRQFKNHDAIHQAVLNLANEHDLKVQIFSDQLLPSLRIYTELFHRAKVIIGPHGSGLANLIFARPGTVVIEGLCYMERWYEFCWKGFIPWVCKKPSSRFSLTFRNVAVVLGLHYFGIVRKDDCLYITPEDVIKPLQFYLKSL